MHSQQCLCQMTLADLMVTDWQGRAQMVQNRMTGWRMCDNKLFVELS